MPLFIAHKNAPVWLKAIENWQAVQNKSIYKYLNNKLLLQCLMKNFPQTIQPILNFVLKVLNLFETCVKAIQ